ncbi:hypothetical protein LCGC14_3109500, partial [marine sediment metagenome]
MKLISKTKENNMENKMGHFIGWDFGVPVRVSSRNYSLPYTNQVLLINEDEDTFTVMFTNFIKYYTKSVYSYELISKGKENNMENKMGHFIDWKFGVPVK